MDHTVIQGLYHGKMQFPFFKGATNSLQCSDDERGAQHRLEMMTYKPFLYLLMYYFLFLSYERCLFWFSCEATAHFLMFVCHKTMYMLSLFRPTDYFLILFLF